MLQDPACVARGTRTIRPYTGTWNRYSMHVRCPCGHMFGNHCSIAILAQAFVQGVGHRKRSAHVQMSLRGFVCLPACILQIASALVSGIACWQAGEAHDWLSNRLSPTLFLLRSFGMWASFVGAAARPEVSHLSLVFVRPASLVALPHRSVRCSACVGRFRDCMAGAR